MRIAERHEPALPRRAKRNPSAAIQSIPGWARCSPSSAAETREPSSCGVVATAITASVATPAAAIARRSSRRLAPWGDTRVNFLRAETDERTARVSALREGGVNLDCVRGAIAAGHGLTAAAGARVLEAGGNAVDACVAAAFVSWVAESPLAGDTGT